MSYFRKNSGTGNGSQTANTPLRMKILVGIILILFAALIGQLAYLQLAYGSRFAAEVDSTDQNTVSKSVPRGIMYDSQGRILVGNKAINAVTYTRGLSTNSTTMYKVANALSNYIEITDEKPSERMVADYYLADSKREAKVKKALPKSQKKTSLSTSQINDYEVAYVEKQLKPSLTSKEKTAALIYNKMSGATTLSTINLKSNGLTNKEIAQVGEHLSSLPGVGIGTDWNRYYPNGSSIKSIIGSVSTTKTGLPSDNLQYYLVNGYSRNDRVGTSYLEKEYEALLKGTKASYKVTSKSGKVSKTEQVYAGQSGASLKLTIDAKYQAEVTKALKTQFKKAIGAGAARLSSGAYAVAINPNTGAVLALSGISYDPSKQKITDNALGNINQSFVMGSVVKGAQVAGGLINKIITPSNSTLPDTPIYLPGSPVKKSVYPVGIFSSLDAPSALEVSSNIYMMQLTLRWIKAGYVAKSYIHMPQTAFQTLRNNFGMFGLGQKTGIDLPGESSGIQGSSFDSKTGLIRSGSVLDESYGNYDAYTPIQLAQYVSTIANGGYRMQPYVVKSIGHTSSDGKRFSAYYNKKPTVQFKIPWTQSELNVIKDGFYRVTHGSNAWGTAHSLKSVKPSISAKTGTAQTFYYNAKTGKSTDTELINETMVGWASSNNPQIAFAIVFAGFNPNLEGSYNKDLAKAMVTSYYKLHKGQFTN